MRTPHLVGHIPRHEICWMELLVPCGDGYTGLIDTKANWGEHCSVGVGVRGDHVLKASISKVLGDSLWRYALLACMPTDRT